jgi:hypothetical protein
MTLAKKEMMDFILVLEMGAKKYEIDGWLKPDGAGSSEKEMHASMFRHLAKSLASGGANPRLVVDAESGLDHLLHVATRALMLYTRRKRGIVNTSDVEDAYKAAALEENRSNIVRDWT